MGLTRAFVNWQTCADLCQTGNIDCKSDNSLSLPVSVGVRLIDCARLKLCLNYSRQAPPTAKYPDLDTKVTITHYQ